MLLEELYRHFDRARIFEHEPMSSHTTFRVGGPADVLFRPASPKEVTQALEIAARCGTPCQVIGNGSNLLVRDGGIRGLVIEIGEGMSAIRVEGTRIEAQAGARLAALSRAAMEASLTGLEFASGIPGTVGGAVAMNAGAYNGEMSQVLVDAQVYADGRILTLSREELALGYRTSRVLEEGMVVLSARFELKEGDQAAIRDTMNDLNRRRREKQPLSYPSAGSTFKRPLGHYAGALIEQAHLKGCTVGGAQVSELHAGFIINAGGATARDILDLIKLVQDRVYALSGVRLEPEVRILGEEPCHTPQT